MSRPVVYQRIAERIRLDIAPYENAWEIPSVRSLARKHGVSLNTIRRALAILTEQGEIALPGRNRRYVRHRAANETRYCKPYPAVGLLSFFTMHLAGEDYMSLLLGSFVSTLRNQGVPVSVLPPLGTIRLRPMPGGVAVGPPESRFSAVAFRSGGPDALLTELVEAGAVVVTLDYLADVEGVDSVAVDCDKEADAGIEFLCRLGHRYIGYLAPRFGSSQLRHWTDNIDPDCRRFGQAMLRAKQRMGLNGSPAYHVECDMDPANSDMAVWGAIDRLWRLKPRPTALVCFDPRLAQQAKATLRLRRMDCPSDASIVVRDLLRTGEPLFTTLASDPRRMGTSAAEHVINRLTHSNVAPARLLFGSRLIEGTTTGPAPMAATLAAGA